MGSREANIERLNFAITTLNEDAEGVHELIARSVDELENATAVGNKAADNASQIIEALTPLTKLLDTQHRDSSALLEEARKASEEQRSATIEQTESLKTAVDVTLGSVGAKTEAACDGLVKTVEDSFSDISAKNLKEHERTRGELQSDILNFKNATSARLDALETEVAKAQNSMRELDAKITESVDAINTKLEAEASKTQSSIGELEVKASENLDAVSKKLLIPIFVAIGLGAIDLIGIALLLLR